MAVSSPVTKHNPRPRKYPTAAARQAAYRSRNEMLEFRAEPKTAETLTRIADTIDVSRSDLLLSMVKFALANHDWARFGLTHKTIPYYQGNPIMATKKPTAKQLAARKRFAEMARSGAFKKRKPAKKTVSQKISQLVHEGYPQEQAVAVALSEERAGKVKRNPTDLTVAQTILKQLGGNKFIAMTGAKEFVGGPEFLGFKIPKNMSSANRVTIKYFPAKDLYEVDFIKSDRYGLNTKSIKTFDNVYADQLRDIFTNVTGMETSLGTMGRKTNPTASKRKVSAVVLMNPRAKKPQRFYQVSIMQEGLHTTWMPIGNFYTFTEAENYSHYLAKQHKNWSIRVHDKRAM